MVQNRYREPVSLLSAPFRYLKGTRSPFTSNFSILGQICLKHELQDIISGNGSVRHGKAIRAIADYLGGKKKAISGAEKGEFLKEKETQVLIEFVDSGSSWQRMDSSINETMITSTRNLV